MPKKPTIKRRSAKNTLRLPDLDHSKTSVLQSLSSVASKRTIQWLTCAQGRRLLDAPNRGETKGKRDHAILAILLGYGLRRAELISLKLAHLQQREDHWAIVDLFGKGWAVASREALMTHQGMDEIIFRYSSSVKARCVSERVLPLAARERLMRARVSSSGASTTSAMSYSPINM